MQPLSAPLNRYFHVFFSLFPFLCLSATIHAQTRYFVSTSGNDAAAGTSWATAKQTLQAALNVAVMGDQIWVKRGTYYPATATSPIVAKSGVSLYGGFSGVESVLSARDTSLLRTVNKTVLSADLQGDDVPNSSYSLDPANASEILKLQNVSNRTFIDGFVFEGAVSAAIVHSGINGVAKAIFQRCVIRNSNYGMLNSSNNGSSHPRFSACQVYQNRIGIGSFPTNNGSCNPQIDSSWFANNAEGAVFSDGIAGTDNAVFCKKTIFQANNSFTNGGAIRQLIGGTGNLSLTACHFIANTAGNGSGGAVYFLRKAATIASGFTLQNTTFRNNSASEKGGAIASNGAGTQVWLRNSFKGNQAARGGAICFLNAQAKTAQVQSNNNILSGNSASVAGGALFVEPTNLLTVLLQNNLLTGNLATQEGGAIVPNDVLLTIKNSIFSGNKAAVNGVTTGGFTQNLTIYNSIIWGNSSFTTSNAFLKNCVIEGGWQGSGSENISDNPLFLNGISLQDTPTSNGDFHTKLCSPATNTGNNSYAPSLVDLDDKTRILANTIDIGAYEQNANFHFATLQQANRSLTANAECDTPDGWTHFYDSNTNTILFSINRNGNDASDPPHNIGSYANAAAPLVAELHTTAIFGAGAALNRSAAAYVSSGEAWFTGNFYWKLTPFNEPDEARPVSVRVYYDDALLHDLTGSLPTLQQDIKKCTVFKIDNPYNPLDITAASTAFHQYLYDETSSSLTSFKQGVFQTMRYVEFETSSFSGGGIGAGSGNNGALPVEMRLFRVRGGENNSANLQWETASEYHSDYFAIERSADGRIFEPIGQVKSSNLSQGSRYHFVDYPPLEIGKQTIFYYRLRPTDFDGTFTYSETRSLVFDIEKGVKTRIFPNPTSDFLSVQTSSADRSFRIIDVFGRIVLSATLVGEAIDMSELTTGVYFLEIADEPALKFVKK